MKIYILLTSFICSLVATAQDLKTKDTTRYYDHSAFSIVYQNQAFNHLNARLQKYYPKSIPQNTFGIAMGGKTAANQFLFQGDVSMSFGINSERGKGNTNVYFVGLNLEGGIFLTRPGAVRIYPFAGFGLDVAGVSAKQRTDNVNFDSVLSNPITRENTRPINLGTFFVSWKSGIAIDFGNPKKPDHPYSFGLRVGYKQSFNNGRWILEGDNNFANVPSDRLKQWSAGIVFYGATSSTKKHCKTHQKVHETHL